MILSGGQWPAIYQQRNVRNADALRRQNANIYVIHVGRTVNRPNLLAVAGRPQNVFYSNTYERLQEKGKTLVESVVFGGLYK